MTKDKSSNVAASVRQRLLNIIHKTGDDPNLIWTRYATERLLYRLSISEDAGTFVLKGAMLFVAWTGRAYRPTADIDFLGHGENSSKQIQKIFQNVCCIDAEPDGLVFDPNTVAAAPINEAREYQGQRVTLTAFLGKARIPVQADVGFGDVVTPKAKKISYPTLLKLPAPKIRAYPRESVIAEKFQAMVILGIANSRMKDFYDLYVLARDFTFDGTTLVQAMEATFKRRKTDIPEKPPLALTSEFSHNDVKSKQWKAFIRKSGIEDAPDISKVLSSLMAFLLPLLRASVDKTFTLSEWKPGGPWK